tara:strand:- start:240 stop:1502 length:1263 start_codon:yes stop_codon:yes gene_type:complete
VPVIQGRTRQQLRQSIGYNLGALTAATVTSNGSTTTLIDNLVRGGDDSQNGKWIYYTTSGSNSEKVTRVSDYVQSSTTMTLSPALAASTAADDTYEVWDDAYSPSIINEFINQAIIDATGHAYDPVEKLDLHGDGHSARLDIPSGISMVSRVDYRAAVDSVDIHNSESTFDEKTDSDFTQSLDTQDRKSGNSALRFVIAAGASAGDFVTDSISSLDLSKYDTLEFWIKSTVATSAGNLKILLDDTASCASPLETLSVPALTADTWKFCRVSLANPETDSAIISVGFEYDSDLGACTVWLDEVKAVRNDSAIWATLSRRAWRLDKEAADLVLTMDGRQSVGSRLIKLVGGDKPALLTADSTATEVDDQFVIAKATALALSAASGGPSTDPDQRRGQAAFWFGVSEQARKTFRPLVNARLVT